MLPVPITGEFIVGNAHLCDVVDGESPLARVLVVKDQVQHFHVLSLVLDIVFDSVKRVIFSNKQPHESIGKNHLPNPYCAAPIRI